jgi:hypothetical protein
MTETVETQNAEKPEAFDVHSIFAKKTDLKAETAIEEPKEKPEEKKKVDPIKNTVKEAKDKKEAAKDFFDPREKEDEDEEEEKEASASKKEEKEESSPEIQKYRTELEKKEKALRETQKWGNEARKQLAVYKKTVEALKAEGVLTDDEARALQDHTIVHADEPQEEVSKPLQYGQIWDKELAYMRKYSPNAEDIDKSVFAFQHLVKHCSQEELEDIFADLAAYEDDEVALTKRMIEKGREYYDDVYEDIHEAGSIRNLKKKYKQKEEELQKRIDKLEAKYSKLKEKHEDFDSEPSGMKLPSGGLSTSLPKDVTFDPAAIFEKRHQKRR